MSAISNPTTNFNHLNEAIVAVNGRIVDFNNKTTDKIKASCGLIITATDNTGSELVLLGKLNKLDRPKPKDDANVHGTYANFGGGVELEDATTDLPAAVEATIREVFQETLGMIPKEETLTILSQSNTRLIKNADWTFFTAAVFHVRFSKEQGDKMISVFNEKVKEHPHHEIQHLSWVTIADILEVQADKDNRYRVKKAELNITNDKEAIENKELKAIYKENVTVSSTIKVANYAAGTIREAKLI